MIDFACKEQSQVHVMGSTSKNSIKTGFEELILWPRSLSMGINGVFGSGREEKGQSFFSFNGVLLLLCSRTNSESQCGKVIHKKSVGKAGNSNFLNFPLSPLIFYVLLSRIDFQSSSVAFLSRKPHLSLFNLARPPQPRDSASMES